MMGRLKSFYHKSEFDYSANFIDPFEYHKTFYLILKIFKVTDIENMEPTYLNQNCFVFIVGLISIIFVLFSLYHGLHVFDIPHMTEAGTYLMVLVYEILIISCTKKNLIQYHNLLKTMKEDFLYVCGPGKKYKIQFFENQLTTWKASILTVGFIYGISIGMVLVACASLIYFHMTYKPGDKWERPLLFPFWIHGVNFYESPIYECAFMFLNISVLTYGHNYVFMIQTQIVWIRHIMTKADIVIWCIENLFDNINPTRNHEEKRIFSNAIKNRLREIIKLHQSMYSLIDDYVEVYKKFLFYEYLACGPVICLTAYCFVEKLEKGELHLILILLCIATTVLYFIPSYLCTQLAIKVNSVCDACWNTTFWNADPIIRPYFVLIMQRSLRPLPLKVSGCEETSVETFSKKITSAYSCFNMLRQANHNV